ncbi:hypothetical protein BXT84_05150 [Sulfobacillus thermotolerans]|uniref:DUF3533 domain-containing protein n=1 Tax=Sulfobacillus thermotolerans TaxID=338644 RepID=A0ABN5GY31_9FIRM|nr:hypothetical protein BXT84_05150 [Sulfobacillus thermotolerans]
MRSLLLGTRKGWLSMAAIAIVPLLYSGAYLSAYWNPYGHLNRLPIDVVNQDLGDHGKFLGRAVVKKLPRGWDIHQTTQAMAQHQLEEGTADLAIIIPKNYTRRIIHHQSPTVSFVVNPGSNYLNDLVMQKESIALTSELNKALRNVSLADMRHNLSHAASDTHILSNSTMALGQAGLRLAADDHQLGQALMSASLGGQELFHGAMGMSTGMNDLAQHLGTLSTTMQQVAQGATKTAQGLSSSQHMLLDAAQQEEAVLSILSRQIQAMANPQSTQSITQQQTQWAAVAQQLSQEQAKLATLEKALDNPSSVTLWPQEAKALAEGVVQADQAANTLSQRSKTLAASQEGLAQKLSQSASAAEAIGAGTMRLGSHLHTVGYDTQVLGQKLQDAAGDLSFVAEPVTGKLVALGPHSNYGKGLSPYFLALSLWVGALVATVIVPGGTRQGLALRQWTSLGLGLAQSIILSAGILWLLPMNPVHPLIFWETMIAIAVTWWTVMRLLSEKLGDGGRLLGIVLLVVQLAGSAGTYPIQLSPPIFQAIHPYLPMTWAIHLLRYAISGALAARVGPNVLWLGLVAVGAWGITQFIPGRIPFNSPPLEEGLDEAADVSVSTRGAAPPM